ncbi:uncharacterized protein LOC104891091 [Beta vulgaris subsp. vulgaris]|uniref:uncharacterized protein LOC104891091 n=1 Tax=Beta vulgaris subsp. vulgaris TaxID=3555 RepID=UPI002546BCB0|nr:uncharacterized protein LOC104891091 [Beta vulgaris subsp. vulgaris]
MKRVNEKCNDGNLKSKIQADLQELDILREVTTCIATFKLQSKFPPGILLQRIKELEKQISKRRKSADAFTSLKKRSASVASPKQLQKRPRLGNV